jgi:8-oxo-dGTP pyrophosphatase MutT (NUDIX family)
MNKIALATAGLLVIKDSKLLLAYSKNKQAWYLPGGKIDKNESSQEALQREIQEELNIVLNPERLKYYTHISAPAYGENPHIMMEQDCFLYDLQETLQPSNEIEEVKFFDYDTYKKEPKQVIGVIMVFEKLFQDGTLVLKQ